MKTWLKKSAVFYTTPRDPRITPSDSEKREREQYTNHSKRLKKSAVFYTTPGDPRITPSDSEKREREQYTNHSKRPKTKNEMEKSAKGR